MRTLHACCSTTRSLPYPPPPFDDTTRRAAYRWLAEVERGLVSRRERRTLANAIHCALQTSSTAAATSKRSVGRWNAPQHAKPTRTPASTGHPEKPAAPRNAACGSRSTRAAWEAFKRRAKPAGTTVSEHLGRLAAEAAIHTTIETPDRTDGKRRVLFVRIAIDDDAWLEFRHRTHAAGWTTARRLGALAKRNTV